jgi:hypothetical protein
MSLYHFSTNVHSRGKGHSAVAAAAYRSGEIIYDDRTGDNYNWKAYRKSHGAVIASEIFLPAEADQKYLDRAALWNGAESAEKTKAGDYKKTAAVAREIECSLPFEMNDNQREEFAREHAKFLVNRYGCAVDMNIHAPHPEGNDKNYHVHFLMPTRMLEKSGFTGKTELELDGKTKKKMGFSTGKNQIKEMRKNWENDYNTAMERGGFSERVDSRSYEDQGLEKKPTIHKGAAVTAMERKGVETEKANKNIEIQKRNDDLSKLQKQSNIIDFEMAKEKQRIQAEKKATEMTEMWDRDKANQDWKDSIAAAGIEAEKLRMQKEKSTGKSSSSSGGFVPKTQKNEKQEQYNAYADYLDRRRAYQNKESRARDQLEDTLEKAYTLEQTQADLKAAQERVKDSNSLWGRSTGKHRQALDDAEAYRKTLANINQRQTEARGVLEKKLDAERPAEHKAQSPLEPAPTQQQEPKSVEALIKSAEDKTGKKQAIKPEFEKTGANDNLQDMIERAEKKAKEQSHSREKEQENEQDRGRDRGGFGR